MKWLQPTLITSHGFTRSALGLSGERATERTCMHTSVLDVFHKFLKIARERGRGHVPIDICLQNCSCRVYN